MRSDLVLEVEAVVRSSIVVVRSVYWVELKSPRTVLWRPRQSGGQVAAFASPRVWWPVLKRVPSAWRGEELDGKRGLL
ncbi:MAG: hypothetical protein KF682_19970 [Nitrospira sp.]|nr:hypothetical protein [Nitrospira sp.]